MSDDRADRNPGDEDTTRVPNVWPMSSTHNPYLHNVFALLGLDPDADERTLQNQVTRITRRLKAGQNMTAHGRDIEETDVTRAVHLTAKPVEFVAERLLAHTVHKADVRQFSESMDAVDAITFQEPEDLLPLPIQDLAFLTRLLPDIDEIDVGTPEPISVESIRPLVAPQRSKEQIYDS